MDFEDIWRNIGVPAFAVVVAGILAALHFTGALSEPMFNMVAVLGVLGFFMVLMTVNCFIKMTSLTLLALTIAAAIALPALAGLSLVDEMLPGEQILERKLTSVGDRLTWPQAGPPGRYLARIQGLPGMNQGGSDRDVGVQITVEQPGAEVQVKDFKLFDHRDRAALTGNGKSGVAISRRTSAMASFLVPREGEVTLRMSVKKPEEAMPITLSIHHARVPEELPDLLIWTFFGFSMLAGALAIRRGEPSFFPVAGLGLVMFRVMTRTGIEPSGSLFPLGAALLVGAVSGAIGGLLINLVFEKLFGLEKKQTQPRGNQ